jgi:DNA-binding Lrp family transcriptional regulator
MASRQNLADDDRKLLRYINDHVRFWSASELAPRFGFSVAETKTRLEALERAGYLRPIGATSDQSEPTYTLTGSGIEAAVS